MADRQTMNVSLPASQEQFVREQVASGRYRSASEVLRDGLRLLEESEHRRLLEKWLATGLTKEEQARLPKGALTKARAAVEASLRVGLEDVRRGRTVDGPAAMARLRERISTKSGSKRSA